MVKITGGKAVSAKLKAMSGPDLERRVSAALEAAGEQIEIEAELSITRGSVSGRGHVPSKPGEPPSNDTSTLRNNIETTRIGPLSIEVSSNAPYAAHLEFGTSKMAARPYMRPAAEKMRPKVSELIGLAVRRSKGKA